MNNGTFLVNLLWLIFGQLLEKIGLHFTPTSGHTGRGGGGGGQVGSVPTSQKSSVRVFIYC